MYSIDDTMHVLKPPVYDGLALTNSEQLLNDTYNLCQAMTLFAFLRFNIAIIVTAKLDIIKLNKSNSESKL